MALTGNQRRYLRGLGHHLDPVVQVGHQGVTPAVVRQLAQALKTHELVKVKLAQAVEDRSEAAEQLAEGTSSELVQQMGRTLLLYKRREKKPTIVLPGPRTGPAQPASKKGAARVEEEDEETLEEGDEGELEDDEDAVGDEDVGDQDE